ncbi:hypothetical protein Taro_032734 [Colocasia esculenta]|uniref:Uncharacterized protein n=1 Tax=Colocasia esculenta TaxID=4460 RepID=A0A843W2Q4_COLES|nr:hypothetical protein [Colocasia esculenta]
MCTGEGGGAGWAAGEVATGIAGVGAWASRWLGGAASRRNLRRTPQAAAGSPHRRTFAPPPEASSDTNAWSCLGRRRLRWPRAAPLGRAGLASTGAAGQRREQGPLRRSDEEDGVVGQWTLAKPIFIALPSKLSLFFRLVPPSASSFTPLLLCHLGRRHGAAGQHPIDTVEHCNTLGFRRWMSSSRGSRDPGMGRRCCSPLYILLWSISLFQRKTGAQEYEFALYPYTQVTDG